MTNHGQKAGSVGAAAEALKEALVAKLQPGVKDSPINDAIYQAIRLVEAFLNSCKEDQEDLDALKVQVKRIMMSQIAARISLQRTSAAESTPERRSQSATTSDLPKNHHHHNHNHKQQPKAAAVHRDHPVVASAQGSSRGSAPASLGAQGHGMDQGRLPLYSRGSSRSTGSSSLDWTLPQRTLNRKAYVRNGDFGRMVLVQDELARKADMARQMEEAEKRKATLAIVNEQMELVRKRREDEREARRRAQLEMDEEILQFQIAEEIRSKNHRDMQESLRNFYAGQVEERQTRKRMEMEERMRENELERQRLLLEERKEKARQEQVARENAIQRERIKRALMNAMEEKAAAKAALVQEEIRYNKEMMAKMDADEEARRRAVAVRQERTRRAFERGGGAALQASFEEQERAAAARAARLAAELEATILEREQREAERRKKQADDVLRELDGQKAEMEAVRRVAEEEALRQQEERLRQEAADKKEREEAKAALRKSQAETRALQKQELAEQHRRRYYEYREPFEERYRWLHAGPMSGTQRAFNNLAVPEGKAALIASITL